MFIFLFNSLFNHTKHQIMNLKSIVLVLLFACKISFSQEHNVFGISAGTNYSSLRGDIVEFESEFSFLFGVNYTFSLKENLSIKAELNYERKNTNREIPIGGVLGQGGIFSEGKYRRKYDYITLPVLLKYNFGYDDPFYVNGGPYLGYIINAEEKLDGSTRGIDITNLYKSFELGISFGVGKVFSVSKNNNLSVEVRNNLGLTSLSESYSIRSNSLNLILGWSFTL